MNTLPTLSHWLRIHGDAITEEVDNETDIEEDISSSNTIK